MRQRCGRPANDGGAREEAAKRPRSNATLPAARLCRAPRVFAPIKKKCGIARIGGGETTTFGRRRRPSTLFSRCCRCLRVALFLFLLSWILSTFSLDVVRLGLIDGGVGGSVRRYTRSAAL